MRIRYLVAAAIMTALLSITSAAQTRFTSAYSNLGKSCKILRGENGTDDASLCNGVGGYQIRIYGAAAAVILNAELKRTDDSFPLTMLDLDFDDSKSRVEWRLANGKPFAIILRVPKYGEAAEGAYFGKVIGQQLIVRGLKGHETIVEAVDAKEPGANAKARELADKAYRAAATK